MPWVHFVDDSGGRNLSFLTLLFWIIILQSRLGVWVDMMPC